LAHDSGRQRAVQPCCQGLRSSRNQGNYSFSLVRHLKAIHSIALVCSRQSNKVGHIYILTILFTCSSLLPFSRVLLSTCN
ncbi:hypothetical protein B0T17DRAFT_576882, partial [Bombardia bombarda]